MQDCVDLYASCVLMFVHGDVAFSVGSVIRGSARRGLRRMNDTE